MATHPAYHPAETGGTYYAYPADAATYSLAAWTTHRVPLTELASPDLGIYAGTLDDAKGFDWLVFSGATQPVSWRDAVAEISLWSADVIAKFKDDPQLGTDDGGLVANAAAAATQSAIASAQSTTAATQSTIAANAAVSAPASTVSLLKIDEDFGKDPGGLLENAIAARKLAEADDILENVAGSQVLNKYERGTSNKLVPTKSAKKIGGGDLTNPTSQRWAGYREEA